MSDRFHHLRITPADFDASLAFYRDVLKWAVTRTWEDAGHGRGAVLSGGGVKVVLAERHAGDAAPPDARPTMHLDIHDVQARFGELPADAAVVSGPAAGAQGTRSFVVRDPDGNLIAFEELHRP